MVVLFKRNDRADVDSLVDQSMEALAESVASIIVDKDAGADEKAQALDETFRQFGDHLKEEAAPAGSKSALPEKLRGFIAALQSANPKLTEAEAAFYLLHNASGRTLSAHLSEITKERSMDNLREVAKQAGGLSAIIGHIVQKGETQFSEHEFAGAVMEAAKLQKEDGESDAQAFSRLFESNVELRKAYTICRGY